MKLIQDIDMDNKLAVVLPVYKKDTPEWVALSVDSLLTQTCIPDYVYIGIDGPIEHDLEEVISRYAGNPIVRLCRFAENRGLACVLNDLISLCLSEGVEFIARMDADDISMPDRLEKQVRFLKEHPPIDVVGGAIKEIDENGEDRSKIIIYPETPTACRYFFARRNPHAHPAVVFRRSFFVKLNGKMYRPEYRQNQDTMLWYDGMMAGTQHANIRDVILSFRMTDAMFKKRRNGWAFAKKQFSDRLKINKGLGYGWTADLYGFAMFCILVSPTWIKKSAYKVFR